MKGSISQLFFRKTVNALNLKTVIVLKLVQYRLSLAKSAYGLVSLPLFVSSRNATPH